MRGTLLGNESTRRKGIREMKDAKIVRQAKKKLAAERKARNGQGLLSFFKGGKNSRQVVVVRRNRSSRKRDDERSSTVTRRTKPPYHGQGTLVLGYVTNNKEKTAQGRSMNRDGAEEREKERRRRQRRRQKEAEIMRNDTRSSRRRNK